MFFERIYGMFDLCKELHAESLIPANAFTYSGRKIVEGIELQLDHPSTNRSPALMIGGHYILRNFRKDGCLYQRRGSVAIARRVKLSSFVSNNTGKEFFVLDQPCSYEHTPILLHAHFDMSSGTVQGMMTVNFAFGASGSAAVIHQDGMEALISFKDDTYIDLLCEDGFVERIVCEGGSLSREQLSFNEMLEARTLFVDEHIRTDQGDMKPPKTVDGMLHGLISLIPLAYNRDAEVRPIIDLMADLYNQGEIRPGVQMRLREVFRKVGNEVAFHMITAPSVVTRIDSPRKNGLAEARAKKAKRAEEDRRTRLQMRGGTNGGSNKKQYKK